ncbi:histone deacetylase complex subunit SAP130-B [Chelonus insularis]|uniref:histone deacetylase complex subunit SAP130-B n=1 Tax=Chelonus insularis TaxID=460826 RepID=UPI00158D9F72|nr:histone deacetylase complex subunit SAP130-B [Chelonus insularis]
MNTNTVETSGDKRLQETNVQSVPHNLTTIQGVQALQTVQNIVQSNVQTIQSTQNVSTMSSSSAIVGKSISLDLNPKLSLMKSVVQSGASSAGETSKITTTLCPVGSAVRIIPSGILSTVDRQVQPQVQVQSSSQTTQQVVTTIPTYHVPRGPAAVANISAPRSTVATPIVRASTGQSVVPISRAGVTSAVSNAQWPAKTSVVYTQPQRHAVPPVTRITTRSPAVYSGQQPRLVAPVQARPIQAVVASVPAGTPSRLLTPVLPSNNAIARIPVSQTRPTGPQVINTTTSVQAVRHQPQTLQTSQQSTRSATAATNRVTVSAPVGTASRITSAASVTVQPAIGRQLSINSATGGTTGGFNRVVIPTQQVPQSQTHPQGTTRVVQTITSLANIGTVSRVIATTTNPSNVARVTQSTPTSVARITGMTLHSLPIATTRAIPAPVKPVVSGQAIAQAVQIKSTGQPTALRVASASVISTSTITTTTTTATPIPAGTTASTATIIINNSNNTNNSPTPVPQSSLYPQYRQTSVQPVRLLVEPSHEENHGKPNASPRPSILRKRDHDNSPAKGVAKNLVPVLTALPNSSAPPSSPPSPRNDRDTGGGQSSGSTTVSATSSPGLDEEPEQSRITINQTMEMSPRKKPRKQQLTGVELTESRCTEEEMQFITEDKIKREHRDDIKDKYGMERKTHLNSQDGITTTPTMVMRARPTPSLLGSSWKNRWGGRLHHYRRPSDVRPREERRPTIAEIAQQKYVLQKIHGWKVYQLTAQMEDLAELEKQVHEKLKATLLVLESQQPKNRQDDDLERANELIKGNMQRSSLISEGMCEARTQLVAIFQHKGHVSDILQRCGNKRAQKKRDK